MKRSFSQRFLLQGLILLLLFILGGFTTQADIHPVDPAQSDSETLDLSDAILLVEDLPPGFQEMPENQRNSMKSMLDMWQGQLDSSNLEMLNFTGYWTGELENMQFVISGLVSPLSPLDQVMIDRAFANPDMLIEELKKMVGGEDAALLKGAANIGESNLAFTTTVSSGSISMHLEYVVARRGPVLVEVATIATTDQQPIASAIDLARLLDDRVAAVVGRETGMAFRPEGPLVPKLTTYIPTPLDVSTQPTVIGTNLLLAALLMLPFGVAAEVFTRTLNQYATTLQDRFRGFSWLRRLKEKVVSIAGSRLNRKSAIRELLQFLGIVFFYGVVFSLLDSSWKPFSLQGLVLLLSMTVAYGLVGVAGDLIQWRAIRRWGYQADLTVRPTNLLLAVFSTTTSRLFSLVPGLMFGTPEALDVDEDQFEPPQRGRLLKISTLTFVVIGSASWLLTTVTAILQRVPLPEKTGNALGGLEAFLLVIFAVTLENLFVQMLGLPGGIGQALKKANRWIWLVALAGVTFAFYHTLINPRGDLARAIQTPNVQVTLGGAAVFILVAFGLHFSMARKSAVIEVPTPAPVSREVEPKPLGDSRLPDQPAIPTTPSREIPSVPISLSLDEDKICPVCANRIKAEARICRFCRARFKIQLQGYCLNDHDVVLVTEGNRCARCGGEVADLHVESTLQSASATPYQQIHQPSPGPASSEITAGTRLCPSCGQMIRVEARICRFCKTRFDQV